MLWTDINEIAIGLADTYPDADPLQVRFTDLSQKVQALEGFSGEAGHVNERILEAIQMAWIAEVE